MREGVCTHPVTSDSTRRVKKSPKNPRSKLRLGATMDDKITAFTRTTHLYQRVKRKHRLQPAPRIARLLTSKRLNLLGNHFIKLANTRFRYADHLRNLFQAQFMLVIEREDQLLTLVEAGYRAA